MSNPDRAAIAYLVASGASCVSVPAHGTIKAGPKPDRAAVTAWWLPAEALIMVSRRARHDAGDNPDIVTVEAALRQAAADHGVALTHCDNLVACRCSIVTSRRPRRRRRMVSCPIPSRSGLLRQALIPMLVTGQAVPSSLFQ
jgi:hypothetical protein